MRLRKLGAVCGMALAVALIVPAGATARAQGGDWTAPRTADGHPDLQGVWANNSATPLQRPEALADRETLTEEELANLKATAAELFALDADDAAFGDSVFTAALAAADNFSSRDTQTGNYNQFWMVERDWDNRTSLIVDPPNGRLPQRTPEAEARMAAYNAGRQRHAHWTDDRSLGERCITFGAPRLGAGYNSYYQIFQTADHVVLLMEMAHDARIIQLTDRPPLADDIRLWHGDSRGYWEGETLVVETSNYSPKTYFMSAQQNLRIEERFTRVSPDVLRYEVRVNDPSTWTQPWTAVILMNSSDDSLYEYACHEGNIGMEGILTGARTLERQEAEGSR
ncbi:MAG: hypothetical protein OXF27_02115 [Acidobacteria bacterium]|nr:hypothetical protein [Acidobacteriota bacterium]